VGDPLPPALTLDGKLVRALSEGDRALGELAGLGRAMPNPHLLIGSFMRREAVLSSRIEDTHVFWEKWYKVSTMQGRGIKQTERGSEVCCHE